VKAHAAILLTDERAAGSPVPNLPPGSSSAHLFFASSAASWNQLNANASPLLEKQIAALYPALIK